MTDKEKYYDEHIAPKLLELAKEAREHGLSFLAIVEWEPGEVGRTIYFQEKVGFPINMANNSILSNGNVDSFWMGIQKHAIKHGHSSIFLRQQGISEKPDEKIDVDNK